MATPAECEAILAQLLDFSKPLDIALFDKVVDGFSLKGDMNLQQIIIRFTEHELAWTRVDSILEQSNSNSARIIALTILESCVKSRWNALPAEQREGIKNFVVGFILKISADEKTMRTQAAFLNKLNVVLIQIVKYEWPKNWPNFIKDLVESSKASQSICSNNMQILLLLSEEVFDYSRDQMTSEKAMLLKSSLNKDFAEIFSLCDFILGNSQNPTLLSSTLKTLLRFLKWIPVEYIFETKLIETLALKFFPVGLFQNITLQCLCEIAYLQFTDKPQYNPYFVGLLTAVMSHVYKVLPPNTDLASVYLNGDERTQGFLRYLSLFITEFLRAHLKLVESASDESRHALLSALAILLRLSLIDDQESDVVVFNICLEYWNEFLRLLYTEEKEKKVTSPLLLGAASTQSPRLQFYEETLVNLRQVLISRMAKPEEVLVVTDENGNVVRERLKNSDSITLYLTMREALIYLTHVDAVKTMEMMCTQLSRLVASHDWAPELLNRLCWAIGSISKALNETQEKAFLARVIKDLLSLVDKKTKKDHKAIIAANIMYVVGQYPRFLKNHWSFLTTVIAKLFEFMHERHPGVQDMACDTFLKIAHKCRNVIVSQPPDKPFINDIIGDLGNAIRDLEPAQVLVFYEAVGRIVAAEVNAEKREQLVFKLMELPNCVWATIIGKVNTQMDELWLPATIDAIDMVLKTNNRVAGSLKQGYMGQLTRIYIEMLSVYKMYSSYVSRKIEQEGEVVTRTVVVRKMRSIKKETLRILTTFVESCRRDRVVLTKFLPELIAPVLQDYQTNCAAARDHEVLQVFTAFVAEFKQDMLQHVPMLFAALFPATLEMITKNFEDFPEHRTAFFALIQAVTDYCFESLLKISPAEFKLVMDSVFWAIKHLDRSIQETGLSTLLALINSFQRSPHANQFFSAFLVTIVNELLEVLTDTFHRSAFASHCTVLARVIAIVETNSVQVPLDPSGVANNSAFLRNHICTLLADSFQNLTQPQVLAFVTSLFTHYSDNKRFKDLMKDFLIQLKEFASFHDEIKQDERERAAAEARNAQYALVPGLQYTRDNIDQDDD